MMHQKRFDCIYVKNKIDFKKYTKVNEYQEIISFYDIISKLTKGDDQGLKPSEYVVNSYITKRLSKALCESNSILYACLLYTSPSPRDRQKSRMPSSA